MKIIILITLICITLTGCDNKKEEKKYIIKTVSKSSVENIVSQSHGKHDCAVCSKTGKKNKELSTSDIKEELMEYEKKIEFAMSSDEIVNSKDLKSVLEKSIQFWSENDWEIFKTKFDFNNTNNMTKLENINIDLACQSKSLNKNNRENIISKLILIADNISEPTMHNFVIYMCSKIYFRAKDYDNATLMADVLYNDCVENINYEFALDAVVIKMESILRQEKSKNLETVIKNWEKDFPDVDFNKSFFIKKFEAIVYFSFMDNEKVNYLRGIKILVQLLDDSRLNEKQKKNVEGRIEDYKDLPVCAEYLKKVNYNGLMN